MAAMRKALIPILALAILFLSNIAVAQRSILSDGYLSVPRIDIDGYGAMELIFRLEFIDQYVLVLEEAVETSIAIANSGVFDPLQSTIDVDEIELPGGKLYSVQLRLLSSEEQYIFSIADVVDLNPEQQPAGSSSQYEPSSEALALYTQQCSSCHGSSGTGVAGNPSLAACANCSSESALSNYIRDTMPLGQTASCDAACAGVLAEYILGAFNSTNQQVSGKTIGFIQTLSESEALRRAAQQLVSRLPTLDEFRMVGNDGDAGMRRAIAGMMSEQAFYVRLSEIFNDYLLTDKYHSRNGSEAAIGLLSSDDFPERRWFDPGKDSRGDDYVDTRRSTNDGVAREPLELINHVVRNDLPFTEILTADYLMVNPYSAKTYGISGLQFTNPNNASEFRPARLSGVPHAGILTSPMFLNRYPTTSTNRNRGRARVVFDLFLDTDVLAIEGVRPGNSVDITTPIPTINNPECSKCHSLIDPVASIFQNWNHKGQYRPARLSKYGWYSDMEPRGFNGEPMPLAGNIDSSVRWLAQQIAADPKFPKSVTRIMVNGLTGKEPLSVPDSTSSSQAEVDAYIAERTLLNDMQTRFVSDGYRLKTLVEEIIMSPYWQAGGLSADANLVAHANTGASYLLTPEQLDRKIASLLGFEWRNSLDSYYKDVNRSSSSKLNNTFHQIYGGIDSDSVTTRLKSPNGLMGSMQLRMANELACYAVPRDFWLPEEQRKLFLFVGHEMSPYGESGELDESIMTRVRQNIQFLHVHLLGEELPLGSEELLITEQLFMNSLNRGRQIILENGGEWSDITLPSDCDVTKDFNGNQLYEKDVKDDRLVQDRQYVIRAWMAVVAYLLADFKFLYS
jgi:cytochrome c553